MLFFRQTLLSVCLTFSCAFALAQPQADNDVLDAINEDGGPSPAYNILNNDDPGSGFSLNAATVDLDISTPGTYDASVTTIGGTFTYDLVNSVIFTPDPDYFGTASVQYTVEDTEPQTSAPATISILVNPVNDAPTITAPGNQIIDEDGTTGSLTVMVNDIDSDVDGLSLSGTSGDLGIIPDGNITTGGSGASRNIVVVPAANQFGGPVLITLEVTDGVDPVQASFTVDVTSVNDAPTISIPTSQTIDEDGATSSLTVTVNDIDDPPAGLVLSGTSGDTDVIPDGNINLGGSGTDRTVVITPAPDANGGPVSITLEVTDGEDPVQASFDVTVTAVNDAPTLTVPGDQILNENTSTGALPVTVADIDNLVDDLDLSGVSDNMTIIPNLNIQFGGTGGSRTVIVTPAMDQTGGPVNIDITVTDGLASNSADFNVTVNAAANELPTITSITDQTIPEEGATAALDFTLTDPDDAVAGLVVTGSSGNQSIIPDGNIVFGGGTGATRTVTVSPAPDQFGGPVAIMLEVTDGVNVAQTAFDVLVTAVNDAPTITGPAAQIINEDGATGALAVTVNDVDNPADDLELTGTSGNAGIIPDGNIAIGGGGSSRTVIVSPSANANGGPVTIVLEVTDGMDPVQTSFDVTVNAVNDLPTITGPGSQTIDEDGTTGSLNVAVNDIDNDVATLVLSGSSGDINVIPNANIAVGGSGPARTVTVTPAANANGGPIPITLAVTDGGAPVQTNFNVTVTAVNDAPTLVVPGPQTIGENTSTGLLPVTVADIDSPVNGLVLTATSNDQTIIPTGNIALAGSGANRTINVTPATDQTGGPVNIDVTVSDGMASNSADFDVTVSTVDDPPTITTIEDQTIPEDGATSALDFTIGDPDGLGGVTVTASSSNVTLIPNANIVLAGTGVNRTVTVTPAANLSGGPVTITIEVDDGATAVQTTFEVTVTAVNDAPTLVGPGNQNIMESTSTGALAVTVADIDTGLGSLVLSGTSDNQTLIPNANITTGGSGANRTVTVTPAAGLSGGPVTITLTVGDGTASNITTFTVTVGAINDPPTITAIGDQSIPEDGATSALAFTIGDPDNAIGSLTVSGTSSNQTLIPNGNIVIGGSGAARTVTVTPAANLNGGPVVITINVSDGTNTTPETFNVTVTPVNDAPTLVGPGNQNIMESSSTGALAVTVADIDTGLGSLVLSGTSDNQTLIPNANITTGGSGANRTVTVTPVAGLSGGPVTITLTVGDGSASNMTTFTVTVGAVNDPPTITAIGNQSIPEDGATSALAFTIGDPDNAVGSLNVSGTSSDQTLIPNGNIVIGGSGAARTVTVTPVANLSGGPVVITINVSDGTNTTPETFNVTVTPVNDAPTIAGPGAQSINENTSTSALAVTVGDIDTPVGSLVLTGTSTNTTIIPNANIVFGGSGANRTVTVTPAANQSGGPVTITVTVSDGINSVPTNFTVTVNAINDAPTITAISDQTINEDASTGALAFVIGDIDTPVGSLTVTGTSGTPALIPNGNIVIAGSGANRTVTITPAANQNGGPVTITLAVSDGTNTTNRNFNVTVTAVNDAPTISSIVDQTITEDTSTPVIAFTIADVDHATSALTIIGASGNPVVIPNANIVFGGSNGNRTVTITPAANQNGAVVITLTVSDGTATTPTTFDVTVTAVNDAPGITSISNQTIAEDNSTGALPFTISDVDNAVASLTVTGSSDNTTLVPNANIVFGGSGANRTVTVTPAANQSGTAVITVNVSDGVVTIPTTFQLTVNGTDDPPTITAIANQTTNEDVPTALIPFTVGDAETALADLTVTGASDNSSLVTNVNIVIAGSGANRTVQVTPLGNQSGIANITLTVSDGTNSTPTSFQLTVNTINDAPTVTTIGNQTINEDTQTAALGFTIGDVETAAGSLTVTGSSDNTALIPNANIAFGGSGASRTVQVTPLANQSGSAVITINVSDGVNTTPRTFQVTVNAVNDPATVTTISSQTINEDTPTGALAFTVGDTETAAASLTVTGTSDNTTLIPNANIVFGGSGAARTVTVTPVANRNGVANITVVVNDGTNDTPTSFQVTVNAVNDAPLISGQTTVATGEEQPLDIEFTHLTVNDPDNTYPNDFTLTVLPNAGYTVAGNTITPNTNVTGTLTVPVQVSDPALASNVFNLQVTVNAVNDPPVITAQSTLSFNEDNTFTVLITHLTITDPDNASGFTLSLANGADYSVSGNIVTPDVNYNGMLTVPVTVSDGTATSQPFNLQIEVKPVNDVPEITGQVPISIAEVQPVAIDLSQLIVFDPDNDYPDDFTLDILSGPNYSITGNTVVPIPNFSGTLLVRVSVRDGVANSAFYNLQILVNSTNDPPVILSQDPLSTNEGQAITINFDHLEVDDPDNTYPTGFTLTILPGPNHTFSGNTITPNPNFEGVLTVGVKVFDGEVDSAPFNLQITVVGINNSPTITGQYTVTTPEEIPITLRLADLIVTDPDSPFPTGFTLDVSGGTDYSISGSNPHNIIPALNFNGTLSVPVTVNDGQLTSASYNLQVQVTAINDAPVITGQNPLTTYEDQPIILKLADLMVTDVDNTFPTGFTLNVLPASGSTYTVVGSTVTPAANYNGTITVSVTVSDGLANSEVKNLDIVVSPVNDAPTLNAINDVTIQEDPLDQTSIALSNITSGANEASQTLVVSATTNKPDWFEKFEVVYTAGTTGTLMIKPKANQFGTATATVRVQDNGVGTPAPNINFTERTFNFIIDPVNDAPSITSTAVTLAETGQPYTYLIFASDVEQEAITFAAPTLPDWLSLSQDANGSATLTGIPPMGTTGEIQIVLQVKDPTETATSTQEFKIVVNARPVIQPFTIETNEDSPFTFKSQFANSFTDLDANPLAKIKITKLPEHGTLKLGSILVSVTDEILADDLTGEKLIYTPASNVTGADTIGWMATDGLFYSLMEANAVITIKPVNDLPEIIALEAPESDTLKYEIGSEVPIKLTKIFDAIDLDGDDIVEAEIGFSAPLEYLSLHDQLIFTDTLGIKGNFSEELGILRLAGKASLQAYISAIRSIRYNLVDADLIEDPSKLENSNRRLYIKLSDGTFGGTKERLVGLVYTFTDLDIASAFTPTGANPVWNIYSPGGVERYKDALIKVYNKRGTLVYEAKGFEVPWNGDGPDGALPADSYFYTIDLKYDKKKYRGIVTILR